MKKFIAFICVVGVTASFAHAGPCRSKDKNNECKPPKEAIEVCEGKTTDSTCKVTSPHGDLISGTCRYTPDEKYFVCVPEKRHKKNR